MKVAPWQIIFRPRLAQDLFMHQQDGKTNSSLLEDMMEYPVATISTRFISNKKYGLGAMDESVMRSYTDREL